MAINNSFLAKIRWNNDGLVPAIVQNHKTSQVLMFAWMNRESLEQSIQSGRTIFWSRSRQELWPKGDTSGSIQFIKTIYLDCDEDCLLINVEQQGSGACHTGRPSCFYRHMTKKDDGSYEWQE